MSELNEGIRIKSWKEWRQGITNAKNRIGAFFSGNPQPTGEVTPEISAAQRRIDNARKNNTTNNTTNTTTKTNTTNTTNNKTSTNQTASTPNLADKTGSSKLVNKDGTNVFDGGPSSTAVRSGELDKQNRELNKTNNNTPYKSPANIKTNQKQSRAFAKNDPRVKLNQFSRTSTYTADDKPGTQVQRSTVFTKHYKTGKELGVMTRNQRRAYDLEAAKFNASKIQTQEYEPDAYDLVLEHLIATQQADTIKEAHYIMMEMDADIIKAIVDEAKIDDVKYGTGKGWNQPDKKRIDIYHARHSYLKKNPPNVRSDRNKRHIAQDVVFYVHYKVERDRKKKHHASRGVKKERGSKN